jgi:hypothetical protein
MQRKGLPYENEKGERGRKGKGGRKDGKEVAANALRLQAGPACEFGAEGPGAKRNGGERAYQAIIRRCSGEQAVVQRRGGAS